MLPAVDWAQPWLAPYRASGEAVAQASDASVASALQAIKPPSAPDFVHQDSLPAGQAYEAHIFQTRTVPTRDNLHDFFNGLVWLAFPQTKRRLNELQAAEIARTGIGATRGPLRDALTLFDENGAVLDAPPALWDALVARDWHALFVTRRALWSEARLLVFGHALLEKLIAPRKAATAHVLLPDSACSNALDDAALARRLGPEWLAQKPFVPLPVLGVPGWCAANASAEYYDDPKVFRPRP
ncbi:hypothetical protein J2W28_005453 [Variovorax boronicumulans]|uniref:DUF3025 domain-containing protein n=1 Tax=Variovorax boronicumulans TaxID=436515 RepID=UPI002781D041|nr:DUF3025 domain-containing protein [Variovorax boronicumulans]MDP9995101.1 hypothetical protein [Variovorax boronicumulans]MDQ0006283.1 hypothetical protein [Variovorax boronicumulans]